MSQEREQLEAGIVALQAQRASLGDAVVDAAIAGLRSRLGALQTPAADDHAQALKQVSILFMDAVGSTSLASRLDPEEVALVMDGLLARGTRVVTDHRGRVLEYAGDNLLAVFGAEAVAEDDAERAVRCGLALLDLGRTSSAEVQARHGYAGFGLRVGIHTGGVLLGGGVDEEDSVRGQPVNIAARMEQTAPTGGLRISHDTYRLVRGAFDVDAQEPMLVKGVEAPMRSYLVLRASPRAFRTPARGIEGVETRMIGRDAELRKLRLAFERLYDPGAHLQPVLVVADAGVGKSRLLHESSTGRTLVPSVSIDCRRVRHRRRRGSRMECCATSSPGMRASSTATAWTSRSGSSRRRWCRCSSPPRARGRRWRMRTCSAS